MGCMRCDRNGCDNIMCDILVDKKYYVCYSCVKDFKKYLLSWKGELYLDSDEFILNRFKEFMETRNIDISEIKDNIEEKVNKFFSKY